MPGLSGTVVACLPGRLLFSRQAVVVVMHIARNVRLSVRQGGRRVRRARKAPWREVWHRRGAQACSSGLQLFQPCGNGGWKPGVTVLCFACIQIRCSEGPDPKNMSTPAAFETPEKRATGYLNHTG